MTRYRPRHGRARGGRGGWLLGEALVLVVAAGAVSVGLPAAGGTADAVTPAVASADPARSRVAPAVPVGISAASAPAAPAPAAAAAGGDRPPPLTASAPARLLVPAIGVDTSLVDLGLRADGAMEVPAAGFPAGWYTGAPTPGELGPSVLAGHVDWAGKPGVFAALRELVAGDEVTVVRQDGSTAVFAVTDVAQFDKDAFPTDAVYGDLDHAGLRLITCGGEFDRGARSYVDNVVVFAELVETRAA